MPDESLRRPRSSHRFDELKTAVPADVQRDTSNDNRPELTRDFAVNIEQTTFPADVERREDPGRADPVNSDQRDVSNMPVEQQKAYIKDGLRPYPGTATFFEDRQQAAREREQGPSNDEPSGEKMRDFADRAHGGGAVGNQPQRADGKKLEWFEDRDQRPREPGKVRADGARLQFFEDKNPAKDRGPSHDR